ncbi:serine hydrolase [Cesiribacter sp. SM1]|uniref:serine hydrolase n=1 Tax=Cesiribacter sp. SM1 TaxID=2861196 RepID=UPI001CD722F2|nr:serine hydrolase [Cesiribacter sp. SM1]
MQPKLLLILLLLGGFFYHNLHAQQLRAPGRQDRLLQQKLETLVSGFRGDVGIYVHHLAKGNTAAIKADTLFPTASMIKIPIAIGLFKKIEAGELDLNQPLLYRDSLLYEGEDLLGSFKDSAAVKLSKVAMLMFTTSDNTASLWAQQLAGTGTAINNWLQENGYVHTRVNSRTPGRKANWSKMGWGQTTPREMAGLLVQIRQGKVISPAASDRLYRNLCNIFWDDVALSQLPPTIQAASKQGSVNQTRAEVVLVNAPSGDYVFCIITKNQQDESYETSNEGWELIRKLSALLWNHFEPGSDWQAPPEALKWRHH